LVFLPVGKFPSLVLVFSSPVWQAAGAVSSPLIFFRVDSVVAAAAVVFHLA